MLVPRQSRGGGERGAFRVLHEPANIVDVPLILLRLRPSLWLKPLASELCAIELAPSLMPITVGSLALELGLTVSVADRSTHDAFELVEPGALDAFYHPCAYAALRGVEYARHG